MPDFKINLADFMRKYSPKAMKAVSWALVVKSVSGFSIAAISGFNVLAEKGFNFDPSFTQESLVATAGAVVGFIVAIKA